MTDQVAREPEELDDGEEPYTAEAASLRRFLEDEVLPWFETRRKEVAKQVALFDDAVPF